jgi:hypothetical protein
VIVIRLRVPDEDLQQAMPLPRHLKREDDHDRERREQLDCGELAWGAKSRKLLISWWSCLDDMGADEVAVKGMVDQLEEELVEEEQSS